MRNIKMVIQYDGGPFAGWQLQAGQRTVQGELQRVLALVTRSPVILAVAGRTDAGVHALGQVANFVCDNPISLQSIQRSINSLLRPDICVTSIEEVAPDFHARFSATSRIYRYCILNRQTPSPILDRFVLHHSSTLSVSPMIEALELLKGEHDFSSFRSSGCQSRTPVRTMYDAWLVQQDDLIFFFFHANGFLQQMIRILVGTLLLVGRGKLMPPDIAAIMNSHDRTKAGATVAAKGLCLLRVTYGPIPPRLPLECSLAWW